MRPLIRPTLFTVAKSGLMFALIAWGTSHSRRFCVSAISVVDRGAFTVLPWSARDLFNLGWALTPDSDFLQAAFEEDESHWTTGDVNFVTLANFPGFLAMSETRNKSTAAMISVRHWLIITIFALFYGVLKFIYRKRPEVE